MSKISEWLAASRDSEQDRALAAAQQNGYAIRYLTDEQRTPEVCLAAVQQNPRAVAYLNAEDFSQSGALELCQWADEHWEELVKHLDSAKALQIAEAVSGALQANQTDRPRSASPTP